MRLFLSLFLTLAVSALAEEGGYSSTIKVTPLLKSSETVVGQPIEYPKVDKPEVTAVLVDIPPGAQTGWHHHPYPCYGYILSGELTVHAEGGLKKELAAGEALIESVNVVHNGVNTGKEPVKLVMFVTGEQGCAFTVKSPVPPASEKEKAEKKSD